jgi:magnesium transporter
MAQSIVSSQGILEIIESTYIAMVQINLGVESNKLNSIQQIMACVTTITIPISCITGIFGMNVPLPYQSGVNGFEDLTPFYVICAILAISSIILFVLFRRIKWI